MDTIVSEPTISPASMDAATFTKWLIGEGPDMAGTVGGAVGDGTYTGRVLDMAAGPTTAIEARYRFNGSDRQFTALVHVEQTGLEAVITGVVTDGWLKGHAVKGEYTVITCDHVGPSPNCFEGTLKIDRDSNE
jgi:hypothetical protein